MQNGRYEILETIGAGASSFVAKARDTLIGRTVAVKTLHRGFTEVGSPEQFLREARIVGQLNDPSIVGLFDVGIEEKGTAYLVMEYVAGKTLEQVLADGPIPFQKACAWGADLASALARAHQAGIIHGDVKPANILVTEEGRVKLGDFGIARFAAHMTSTGRVVGTPAYLSPEQIAGKPQDGRSDLFSLAIVIYQMVTGERAFDGTSLGAVCAQIMHAKPLLPSRRNPAIPVAFDRVLLRCLAKDPADRYATGDELARDLYPFARRAAESAAPRRAPRAALALLRRAAWAAGVTAILAAACVPAARHLRQSWRVPPAPPTIAIAPKVPAEAFIRPGPVEIAELTPTPAPAPSGRPVSVRNTKRKESARRRAPSKQQPGDGPSTATAGAPQLQLPTLSPGLTFPKVLVTESRRVPLHIEVLAQASDETLAIYADRELLFTASLRAGDPKKALHLEGALSRGPHQLRVALYRPDKSLHTEKEGLAEIRDDASYTLGIRVARHSKFLWKRDTALEVSWPSAAFPPSAHSTDTPAPANSKPLSASFRKD